VDSAPSNSEGDPGWLYRAPRTAAAGAVHDDSSPAAPFAVRSRSRRTEEHLTTRPRGEQVEDHLRDDHAGRLAGRRDVPKPTVAKTVTVKYRESERVSDSTLRLSGLACSIMKYGREEKEEHRHGDGECLIARTAECRCRMIARTW
jgi:hypothetical protein